MSTNVHCSCIEFLQVYNVVKDKKKSLIKKKKMCVRCTIRLYFMRNDAFGQTSISHEYCSFGEMSLFQLFRKLKLF